MQLPVIQAKNLIEENLPMWIDEIYTTSIPSSVSSNIHTNVILITETINEPLSYGNNVFKHWEIGVELQIFYKAHIESDFSMMNAEIELANLFKKNNWFLEHSRNHIKDPDTKQLSKVFYFTKKEKLKEDI